MLEFKEYLSLLRELSVTPDYRQGNTFNPYYDLTKGANSKVKSLLIVPFESVLLSVPP